MSWHVLEFYCCLSISSLTCHACMNAVTCFTKLLCTHSLSALYHTFPGREEFHLFTQSPRKYWQKLDVLKTVDSRSFMSIPLSSPLRLKNKTQIFLLGIYALGEHFTKYLLCGEVLPVPDPSHPQWHSDVLEVLMGTSCFVFTF